MSVRPSFGFSASRAWISSMRDRSTHSYPTLPKPLGASAGMFISLAVANQPWAGFFTVGKMSGRMRPFHS